MSGKKSFSIHSDFYEELCYLTAEKRGDVLLALINWAEGEEITELSPECAILFRLMSAQMERISKANSENGKRGGAKEKNSNISEISEGENKARKKSEISEGEKSESKKSEISESEKNKRNKPTVTNTVSVTNTISDSNIITPPDGGGESDAATNQNVVDCFNSICVSLPKVTSLSKSRKEAIETALKSFDLVQIFKKVEQSDYLTGRSGGWKNCAFDWILKPDNLIKIYEGNYDNKMQKINPNSSLDLDEYERKAMEKYARAP